MKKNFALSLEIYDETKILQAIEDFSEVSSLELNGNILHISGESDQEIQESFHEFMNYVLSL